MAWMMTATVWMMTLAYMITHTYSVAAAELAVAATAKLKRSRHLRKQKIQNHALIHIGNQVLWQNKRKSKREKERKTQHTTLNNSMLFLPLILCNGIFILCCEILLTILKINVPTNQPTHEQTYSFISCTLQNVSFVFSLCCWSFFDYYSTDERFQLFLYIYITQHSVAAASLTNSCLYLFNSIHWHWWKILCGHQVGMISFSGSGNSPPATISY